MPYCLPLIYRPTQNSSFLMPIKLYIGNQLRIGSAAFSPLTPKTSKWSVVRKHCATSMLAKETIVA